MTVADESPTIRRRNPRLQGEIGVADAIASFTRLGWGVAIPLQDNQKWDLVVEDPAGTLHRVEVKTTTHRAPGGRYQVMIRTSGGNRSRRRDRFFDASVCDLLYVLTDDGLRYLIPTERITARAGLSLGAKWDPFRLTLADSPGCRRC